MSIVHITVEMESDGDEVVVYKILCSDFSDSFQLENFGVVKINKKEKTFTHENDELWVKNKIYPIQLFRLSLEKRKEIIKRKYCDYSGGIWAIRLLAFIDECFEKGDYPKKKLLIV